LVWFSNIKQMLNQMTKTLRLVLGDQLNHTHSWYQDQDENTVYVLMEVASETNYVQHHIQKISAFFLAMRAFANWLSELGHQTMYIQLDDPEKLQSFTGNLRQLIEKHQFGRFEYQLPDEFRVDAELNAFCTSLSIPFEVVDTEHFYTTRHELSSFFEGKKTFLMENFYRHMRKKHHVLVDEAKEPYFGQWNLDQQNRQRYDAKVAVPTPHLFENDAGEVKAMLDKMNVQYFGEMENERLIWPVTRAQSLEMLQFFVDLCLPQFGTYQDSMETKHWSLFHARLSFSMNCKLLSPKEVMNAAISAWEQNQDRIEYHQLEGFVRQIIGWREYMRGIYWAKMPEYAMLNYFDHQAKLPSWFWTGNTKLNCLKHAIGQSLQYAYSHHIQRLMITGNFALLAGIHPDEVDAWYLGIYIDALDWVEITNTRGMSQFADGGIVGSKPYVSSANYIDKMSNYCQKCFFASKLRTGERACPFNSLYWNFHQQQRTKLERNPRIGMVYKTWDKFSEDEKQRIVAQAAFYLKNVDSL
jgi:deoxyribodipyrimidine photolyase-related protein